MPALVVPQALLLRLIWQYSGVDTAVNVIGVRNPTSIALTQTLVNTIGTSIKGFYTSSGLGAQCATAWALSKVGMRDISIANQAEILDTAGSTVGSGGATILPQQVSFCVTTRTALAGRRYRGRVYLGGYATTVNSGAGVPTAAVGTAAVAFVNGVGSALSSSGFQLAVVSRANSTAYQVTTVEARRVAWTTQRRRLIAGI